MSDYLGRARLSAHDPDPESSDHTTPPGHWVTATCAERDAAKALHAETIVFSGLSDISGQYGEPSMFTEWGSSDRRTPLWADLRYLPDLDSSETPADPKPCEHKIYVLDTKPTTT